MLKFVLLAVILPLTNTLDRVEEARRQGQYQDALTLLQQVQQESPDAFRINNLLYLQSVLQQQAGLNDEARQGFETVLAAGFPLPDSVLLHLIDVTDRSDLDQRRKYFQGFLERFPAHPRWSSVALEYADLLGENNRDDEARRWYERLISSGRMYVRTSRLRVAQLLLNPSEAGDPSSVNRRAEAIARLSKLLAENDHDPIALEAATQLRKIETINGLTETDLRHRAMAFMSNHDGNTARTYLNRLVDRFPESAARPEYEYLIARALYLEDRRKDAIAAYDRTYRKYPSSEWGIYSRYLSGNLSLAFTDYQQAVLAFRDVTENHADSEYFDRALAGLAEALVWLGDRAGAEQALTKGLTPPGSRSYAFHYQLARLRIEDGRYGEALSNLKAISQLTSEQLPSGVTREEVLFWKGFCEQQTGQAAESQQSYQAAANGRANYFGYLARQRLESPVAPGQGATPDQME